MVVEWTTRLSGERTRRRLPSEGGLGSKHSQSGSQAVWLSYPGKVRAAETWLPVIFLFSLCFKRLGGWRGPSEPAMRTPPG